MTRTNPRLYGPEGAHGYDRPTEITCKLCGTKVPVGPVGRIPEYHPECKGLYNALTQVQKELDRWVPPEGTPPGAFSLIRSKLMYMANAGVNKYGRPKALGYSPKRVSVPKAQRRKEQAALELARVLTPEERAEAAARLAEQKAKRKAEVEERRAEREAAHLRAIAARKNPAPEITDGDMRFKAQMLVRQTISKGRLYTREALDQGFWATLRTIEIDPDLAEWIEAFPDYVENFAIQLTFQY